MYSYRLLHVHVSQHLLVCYFQSEHLKQHIHDLCTFVFSKRDPGVVWREE
jgi:hypothetical protein